jgi:hypothetical protein
VSYAKAKGRNAENLLADYLAEYFDLNVERRRQKGTNDEGDLSGLRIANFDFVVEVKDHKADAWSEMVAETEQEIVNRQAAKPGLTVLGFAVRKKKGTLNVADWYAVTSVRQQLRIIEQLGKK